MRPSNIVLLALLPLVVYIFVSDLDYRAALRFLLPGLQYTITVTVLGYALAATLGLVFALLLLLKPGERTTRVYAIAAAAALAGGAGQLLPRLRTRQSRGSGGGFRQGRPRGGPRHRQQPGRRYAHGAARGAGGL